MNMINYLLVCAVVRKIYCDRFKNDNENLMYQKKCIIIGDYLYNFDINDNAYDDEKIKAFLYKY